MKLKHGDRLHRRYLALGMLMKSIKPDMGFRGGRPPELSVWNLEL
jgi:hypothetical protein